MSILFWKAYLSLLRMEIYVRGGDFSKLYRRVQDHPIATCGSELEASRRVCSAVDMACIWYWKEVLCLQRSAVVVCLLRNEGVAARLVIGTKQLPFKAHAWVEVDGWVVNDKPYVREIYAVIDRC
jgi:Transglutaminase-like superfamily